MMNKICWVLTPKCNYDCWFCRRHFNDVPEPSKDIIDKIIEFINNRYKKVGLTYEKYLGLDGGECTISPYIFDILENVKYTYLCIGTNLACSIDTLNKILLYEPNYISTTFHAEYTNPEEFFEKIKIIYQYKPCKIRFTFEKNDYDYIMERYYPLYCKIIERFPFINSNNRLIKINSGNYIHIDKEILKYFNNAYIKNIEEDRSPYYNQLCKCHNDHITINYNGDVYPCISLLEKKESRLFSIMNNNSDEIYNITSNIKYKCMSEFCCNGI